MTIQSKIESSFIVAIAERASVLKHVLKHVHVQVDEMIREVSFIFFFRILTRA